MNEAVETLTGLVKCYSPSGEERSAVEYLIKRMRAVGFDSAFRDSAGNAIGIIGRGPKQIVFLGHIDTVPGEIPVRLEKGILYGRGTVDAKGPLATFVEAVVGLGALPGWQFVVIGAVDEERNSTGARYVVERYSPELTIIGEPSRWDRITLGFKGSLCVKITVRRPVGHTAGRSERACEVAVDVWGTIKSCVENFNNGRERVFYRIQAGLLELDSGRDGFQEWATLLVGFRLPLGLSPDTYFAELIEVSGSADVQSVGYPIPAYRADKNTPLVRAFLGAIRQKGGKPGFVVKSGTSDMNIVAPEWNCPVVAYGPGDSALDHTQDEHILLEEYARAVEVLKLVLRRVCQ